MTSHQAMLLTDLATETVISIAQYLLPSDLLNLTRASRQFQTLISSDYVWQRMTEKRFPEIKRPTETQVDFKEVYRTASALTVKADKMGIVWLDGNYWKLVPGEDGDEVAELRSVCWFDVCGSLKSVPKGEYVPVFKIQVQNDYSENQLRNIKFSCGVWSNEEGQVEKPTSVLWRKVFTQPAPVGTWLSIRLAPIVVEQDYEKVSLWMVDHSDSWKGGLLVKEFSLEKRSLSTSSRPVPSVSYTPAAAAGAVNEDEGERNDGPVGGGRGWLSRFTPWRAGGSSSGSST
ncbi:hypothetical protein HDU96_009917 [Phlyctochytrium bullatum]|nr:hypothetical protein HDU96_009917 [Phlyctochytrium bullatum]